jgi:2-polyprenyl-3-methyl-5-hydroxy-6-metoxy-1,4-benzoquinol methylase
MSASAAAPRLEPLPAGDALDPACALCGGRQRRERFREGPWTVVTCTRCDLTYVTPRLVPEALLEHVYDASYWRSPAPRERGYLDYLGDGPLHLATFRRRLRGLERWLPPTGRALDVGCGAGDFLRTLVERGWQVAGVEPSRAAREAAARTLGVGVVRAGTLEQAGLEPGSFDLVTLWDVLEHLPDPLGSLRSVRALLRPTGRLVIETQDIESAVARRMGRRWHHFKHAEHLVHFHRGTLARALELSGFEPLGFRATTGGKYVSRAFVVERSARLHPLLPRVLAPLSALLPRRLWVDLRDELVCVAAPRAEGT